MNHDRSRKLITLATLVLVLTLGTASTVLASESAAPTEGPAFQDAVEGEMVVLFEQGTSLDEVESTAADMGASIIEYDPDTGLALLAVAETKARARQGQAQAQAATTAEALQADSDVIAASPNYIYTVSPGLGNQDAAYDLPAHKFIRARDPLTGESAVVKVSLREPDESEGLVAGILSDVGEILKKKKKKGLASSRNNDPLFGWGWEAISADAVWPDTTTAHEIAILDTGADFTHAELGGTGKKGKLTPGHDWVNGDDDPTDDNGHGTHVTGIAIGSTNNGIGMAGVSNGNAYIVKVCDSRGFCEMYDIARGLQEAADRDSVKVINLSLGGGPDTLVLDALVDYAVAQNKLLVIAAGNDNTELTCSGGNYYPACYATDHPDNIIVVAASGNDAIGNDDGEINYSDDFDETWAEFTCQGTDTASGAPYSNYGGEVDIIAPGTDIISSVPSYPVDGDFWQTDEAGILKKKKKNKLVEGPYDVFMGTSMAAPHVAGAAARAWAEMEERGETATPATVKAQLLDESESFSSESGCWPSGVDEPFLFMPGAMELAAIFGHVYNADTGVAILDAELRAERPLGTMLAGDLSALQCGDGDPYCAWFMLRALPLDGGQFTWLTVNHGSYTNGIQPYVAFTIDQPGWYFEPYVSLPQVAGDRWSFVTTWTDENYDVDGYLFLPPGAKQMNNSWPDTPTDVTWVGPWWTPVGASMTGSPHADGHLDVDPFARLMYESTESLWGFLSDSIAVIPGKDTLPPDVHGNYAGDYTFVMAEGSGAEIGDVGACVWVWHNGTIQYNSCLFDPAAPEPFWVIGHLNYDDTTRNVTFTASVDTLAYDDGAGGGAPEYTDYTGARTFSIFGQSGPGYAPIPPRE